MFRKTAIVFSHMAMNNKAALRIPDIPYPIDYIIKVLIRQGIWDQSWITYNNNIYNVLKSLSISIYLKLRIYVLFLSSITLNKMQDAKTLSKKPIYYSALYAQVQGVH